MTKKLDPLISEFETEEQAESYDRWFRKKVQDALDDKGPDRSHDEVMAEMTRIIEASIKAKAS